MNSRHLHRSPVPQVPALAHPDYVQGLEQLLSAVQAITLARDMAAIQAIARTAVRAISQADGATFVLKEGNHCHYVDEDAIAPLWKGQQFPLESCISGWSMLNRQAAVIPHVYTDPRVPQEVYLPTFVQSLVVVPIRISAPIGALGAYWAHTHEASQEEVQLLQVLADSTAIAIENVQVYAGLESRIRERTAELQAAHDKIRKLAMTDDLTGLSNRRGFYMLARQALHQAARAGQACAVAFIDLDGLKHVNDTQGHDIGDTMLADAANLLRSTLREADIIARMGGDEFCVLALDPGDISVLRSRLDEAFAVFNEASGKPFKLRASIGITHRDKVQEFDLIRLLSEADNLMYAEKKIHNSAA